jgi:uncharacterized protein DUF402
MTVVKDEPDELVVFRRPGHPICARNAELGGPEHFRHRPVVRWRAGWREDVWRERVQLVVRRPQDEHAISLVWQDGRRELHHWYIDLASPLTRTPTGFVFVEHGLDVVVRPDLTSWYWKDEDELDWSVEHGIYSGLEAKELKEEGERAVDRLVRERDRFERWRSWRPDPSWPIAKLPSGWDVPDE